MAPPRSRLRKQKRKKLDAINLILMCASITILFLFYISFAVIDDSDLDFDENGSNHADLVTQCRESCSDVILSRDDIVTVTSPGSLAFSAVDALFNFREGEEEIYTPTTTQGQKQGQQGQRKNSAIFSEGDAYKDLSSRPKHLPVLIATLVGTTDGNNDFDILPQRDLKGGTRQVRNDQIRSPYGHQVEISTRSSDDSVAMVAAAAAAALWSESENRQGRLRMKVVNDEWESSLRWIASWGQQQHGNTGTTGQSINASRSRTPHHADRGLPRKKRRKGTALKKEITREYSGFSELLDSCVAQCTGGTMDGQIQQSSMGRANVSEVQSDVDIVNFTAMISALKLISSPFVYSADYFRSLQANIQLIRGLFGIAVSTAIMLVIRNMTDWWRRKTSLKLLLEEENYLEKLDSYCKKKNKARISGKKSSVKKTRRKRKDGHRLQKSHTRYHNTNSSNFEVGDEDVSIKSESSDEIMSFVGGIQDKQKLGKCVDDSSIDQCSKDHASSSSTSSYISCDSDPEFCLIGAGPKNTKGNVDNIPPTKHFLKQRKLKRRKTQVASPKPASSRERCKAQSPLKRKLQLGIKPQEPQYTLTEGATVETGSLTKCDQDTASIMTADSPSVPTEEQREEASRLLREFQSSQIEKIIKSQIAQRRGSSSPLRKTSLHSITQPNVVKDSEMLHQKYSDLTKPYMRMEESFRLFPPRANTDIFVDDANESTLSAGTDDVGQSILDMLEETADGVERKMIPENVTTEALDVLPHDNLLASPLSIDKKLTEVRTKIRSIALGGLLTSKNNTASSVSSNPWCTGKLESSCNGQVTNMPSSNLSPTVSFEVAPSYSQELNNQIADYKDPNICLQVSAREFSPSWDSSPNRVNHAQMW